jgi:hypothetical protein
MKTSSVTLFLRLLITIIGVRGIERNHKISACSRHGKKEKYLKIFSSFYLRKADHVALSKSRYM